MQQRLTETPWVWAIALAGVGAFDVWLMVKHRPSLSYWAGAHPGIALAGCAGLYAHFNSHRMHLERVDPLALAARALRRFVTPEEDR